jgi:hypothetical protein
MKIEYRSSTGRRLEINANGGIMPGSGPVNLRAMGCPEHIARKVETGQVLRRAAIAMSVTPAPDADAQRRAKAARIGQQIADDNRKLEADTALKNRMQAAAGIVHGRR